MQQSWALQKVQNNGLALGQLPYIFQNNKKVVLTAVSQNEGALKYASNELRNDREIILAAVT